MAASQGIKYVVNPKFKAGYLYKAFYIEKQWLKDVQGLGLTFLYKIVE